MSLTDEDMMIRKIMVIKLISLLPDCKLKNYNCKSSLPTACVFGAIQSSLT